jgi:hypothetical protein
METEWIEVTDESGRRTKVLALYPMIDTGNHDGFGEKRGLPAYRTLDGEHLNKVGNGFVGQRSGRRFTPA